MTRHKQNKKKILQIWEQRYNNHIYPVEFKMAKTPFKGVLVILNAKGSAQHRYKPKPWMKWNWYLDDCEWWILFCFFCSASIPDWFDWKVASLYSVIDGSVYLYSFYILPLIVIFLYVGRTFAYGIRGWWYFTIMPCMQMYRIVILLPNCASSQQTLVGWRFWRICMDSLFHLFFFTLKRHIMVNLG